MEERDQVIIVNILKKGAILIACITIPSLSYFLCLYICAYICSRKGEEEKKGEEKGGGEEDKTYTP